MAAESRCSECGQRIRWVSTSGGGRRPLDYYPDDLGNIVLDASGCTGPLSDGDRPILSVRYTSHFVTCPARRPPGEDDAAEF